MIEMSLSVDRKVDIVYVSWGLWVLFVVLFERHFVELGLT